ncbi:23S rRNA (guanosine(2251)-2'-O)-methyltransferase RlmB [Bombilactobacillus thymidiniphilus]|uniref:23S rRNA (Guanosine(2251)-2'-O)-methyltransferase RlmB n=1 Tax=Bombilactobacillus thymidiniphilus TaxID=2923363 RepID=A0ABY4PFG8_9LACO|nr:23S rRNA (guanosine(2251)-2'-O)-methyltransferase RlmB [Bombilactobacillus thymidiniphilus]UQS84330.1 23S rRNA (guanosine(2251)-2'-O)-methyltransferase RlmB [Bombilactobacillus thymidiniphilus]
MIFGKHATLAVLRAQNAPQKVNKIFLQHGLHNDAMTEVVQIARQQHLVIQDAPKTKLDDLADNGNHQGIVLTVTPFAYTELSDLLQLLQNKQELPFFVILDNLNDPHNFGSILRTADAVGVNGIIIPKRRSVGVTSVVAKTSTGAIEHLPIVRVTNLVQTIKELKERGIWIFGTDMQGTDYQKWNAKGAVALVIGNEGKGLSPLVKKQVDQMLTIPMVGHVQSLNASVAAGVLLYQALRSRSTN